MLQELARIRDYYAQFPFVRRSALQFGAPASDNDLAGMLRNLVKFVRDRVRYVPDPHGFELVTAPDVVLAEILSKGQAYGDCDDHVLLLNTLLASVGFPTAFVAVKQDSDEFNHVLSAVSLNGKWIEVDPCDKSQRNFTYSEKFIIQ